MLALRKLADCITDEQRWEWYAEVYAWRIVRGYGNPDDKTCPVDPDGKWHNQALVDEAVSRFRRTLAAERHNHEDAESQIPETQQQNQRYARALAWRQGRLDEYDAIHHPDLLAKRGEQIAKTKHVSEAVSNALDDLGVTSQAAE